MTARRCCFLLGSYLFLSKDLRLGFCLPSACSCQSLLLTLSFGRSKAFFFGRSAVFPCLSLPLGKITVILLHNDLRYGPLYNLNCYAEVKEKDCTYYEVYTLPISEKALDGYKEISFVCLRHDGAFETSNTVGLMYRTARKKVKGLEDFHFHMLCHTFTSNLLPGGAAPKDV